MFIVPYNKDNPVRTVPWVVIGLIVINAIILIVTYCFYTAETIFHQYGFTPANPHLATMLSGMFLHAGFWHLAGNMFFLWMFGNQVENMFGRWLFALAYLVSGIAADGLHYLLNPHSATPCVGASGAISGVVGIYFVLFPKSKFDLDIYLGWSCVKTIPTRTHTAVGAWFGEQLVLGLVSSAMGSMGGIAFWAHVGGFMAGVGMGFAFKAVAPAKTIRARRKTKHWYMQDQFNREDDTITQLKL